MRQVVELSHDYPGIASERLWELATDLDALAEVMQGLASFEGLPSGRCFEGQRIEVKVRLFGRLPPQPYEMQVMVLDDEARVMQSAEQGAGVKSWCHRLWVEPTADGCTLHDRIEIDAGWLTPLFALWARFMYKRRHPARLRMLGLT